MWLRATSCKQKSPAAESTITVINKSEMSRRREINRRKNCCTDVLSHLLRLRFTPEELEQRDKSRKIDKFLEKDKNSFRRQVMWGFSGETSLSPPFVVVVSIAIFHPSPMIHFFCVFHIYFHYRRHSAHHGSWRASIVYCLHIFQVSALLSMFF